MSQGLVTASYIVAAVLFILSLAGLSKQETAKHGNLFGIAGMAIALLSTVFNPETSCVHWLILAMVIRRAIGVPLALKVDLRSEDHTSVLQSQTSTSNAVFCLKRKNTYTQ